jgi:anti-sigma B factor antagonist
MIRNQPRIGTNGKDGVMKLNVEAKGGVLVARIEENQVGAAIADELRLRIRAELPQSGARLAIDLSKVDFLDSSGLGALVSLLKAVRPCGDLVLFGMRPSVAEILRLTHLDAVFSCEPDEAAALARISAESSAS